MHAPATSNAPYKYTIAYQLIDIKLKSMFMEVIRTFYTHPNKLVQFEEYFMGTLLLFTPFFIHG